VDLSNSPPIRVVFFGTPSYSVPTIRLLATEPTYDLRLVVTQPDRPAGRGHKLVQPPAKEAAESLGIPVIQPETLRDDAVREQLRAIEADLFVVAAYGRIFSRAILDIPRRGCLNLHASLLPKYRGAAPVTAAILNGDLTTGVTLMLMERGLDTGPTVGRREIAIEPQDTTDSLTARLANVGAELAHRTIPRLISGEIAPLPQPGGGSIVRQVVTADGAIDWSQSAEQIERRVRAMWPWPRAATAADGNLLQIHQASVLREHPGGITPPGTVTVRGSAPVVVCGGGALVIEVGQVSGGRAQSGSDLVRGRVLLEGQVLTSLPGPETPLVQPVEE
jgi:methionyl-tRNA formyltransferase